MARDIIKHYPEMYKRFEEIKVMSKSENRELEKIDSKVKMIIDNRFLDTLDLYGIEKWENMLNIPISKDTLEVRRTRIKAKLKGNLPYTFRALEKLLVMLYGNTFRLEIAHNLYTLKLNFLEQSRTDINTFLSMLRSYIPANLVINFNLESFVDTKYYVGLGLRSRQILKLEVGM